MCKVSDKIKFCTCTHGEINLEDLKDYWVLYRIKKEGFEFLIGSFQLPNENAENFELNKLTILNRLKEIDAFDIPIEFENDDKLVVYLNQNLERERDEVIFSFRYNRRKWVYEQYDPLELSGSYNEFKNGYFDNLK